MTNKSKLWMTLTAGVLAVGCGFAAMGDVAEGQDSPETTPAPERKITESRMTEAGLSALIDREIEKVWQRDGVKPTDPSSDSEFLRRVYIDATGTVPTPAETRAFLADKSKDKRERVIAKLVNSDAFGRHMADLWGNVLIGRSNRSFNGAGNLFAVWMAEEINAGTSWRDIVYEIIAAKGGLSENPAIAMYARTTQLRTPDIAGRISRTLTGVQIQCAQCHDHPYEEAWTEEVFGGVASFFSPAALQINRYSAPVEPRVNDGREIPEALIRRLKEADNPQAKARLEDLEKYMRPVTMDGKELTTRNRAFWRPYYARWVISKENDQSARYMVNRFWSFAFGSGILNPVDDFNSFNEASHPELLEALAEDFIASGWDIKRLYRAILNSRTYQLSSQDAHEKAETWHFAAYPVKQLTPETFFSALLATSSETATAIARRSPSPFALVKRGYDRAKRQNAQSEKMENPNQRQRTYTFDEERLKRFEDLYAKMDPQWFVRRVMSSRYSNSTKDDEANEVDGFTLSIDQALAVMNGGVTNGVASEGRLSVVQRIMREHKDIESQIDEVFLLALCRTPTRSERKLMVAHVKESKDKREALADVLFAVISTTEFATNH